MVKKKRNWKRPEGFLSPKQVASRAKKIGIHLNPRTLAAYSNRGKIPFAQKIPGNEKGWMFPEKKLKQIISATPGKAIMPKGSMSSNDLINIGKKRDLKISIVNIQTKLKRIMKGLEPAPKGLATDIIDSKHRYIIPKELAQQILKEARERKNLPKLLETGAIVLLSKISLELGFSEKSLHANKRINSFRIGQSRYISRAEAKRVKKFYRKKKLRRLAKKPRRVAEKAVNKKSVVKKKTIKKKAVARKTRKAVEKTVIDNAETATRSWIKQNTYHASKGQLALFERVAKQAKGLPLKQFEKKILPLLERILYR